LGSLQCSKRRTRYSARDIQRAIDFYTQQLGFKLAFGDKADPPNYVGFRRDAVVLHLQFQFEHEMGTIRLRFLVENPDALFNEYRNVASSARPTAFVIRRGARANSPFTTWTATRSPSTAT
jgi:catechol 2,3-dioxygenase-like lactoylglutathione lyase family enzyme